MQRRTRRLRGRSLRWVSGKGGGPFAAVGSDAGCMGGVIKGAFRRFGGGCETRVGSNEGMVSGLDGGGGGGGCT